VPSAAASYSERSVLGRPMSNRSWIHIWSRRGNPRWARGCRRRACTAPARDRSEEHSGTEQGSQLATLRGCRSAPSPGQHTAALPTSGRPPN
jgi:hypothetical protein